MQLMYVTYWRWFSGRLLTALGIERIDHGQRNPSKYSHGVAYDEKSI
jgi:hypothetical protein